MADLHEHHHDHDHEHEHDHGPIHIDQHEGALIGTVSGMVDAADYEGGQKLLTAAMETLAAQINEEGGVVGHIKFILSEQSRSCQISVTDDEAFTRQLEGTSFRADGAVIVFCVEEEELHEMIEHTVGKILLNVEEE